MAPTMETEGMMETRNGNTCYVCVIQMWWRKKYNEAV